MAIKKKAQPTVQQGSANPDVHLILLSGDLVGIIGHVEGGDGTLYFPGSYRCVDGEWRRPAGGGPMTYTPEEAMDESMTRAQGNVGTLISRPHGNLLSKDKALRVG